MARDETIDLRHLSLAACRDHVRAAVEASATILMGGEAPEPTPLDAVLRRYRGVAAAVTTRARSVPEMAAVVDGRVSREPRLDRRDRPDPDVSEGCFYAGMLHGALGRPPSEAEVVDTVAAWLMGEALAQSCRDRGVDSPLRIDVREIPGVAALEDAPAAEVAEAPASRGRCVVVARGVPEDRNCVGVEAPTWREVMGLAETMRAAERIGDDVWDFQGWMVRLAFGETPFGDATIVVDVTR